MEELKLGDNELVEIVDSFIVLGSKIYSTGDWSNSKKNCSWKNINGELAKLDRIG